MNQKLSDEQVDRLARRLLQDFAADDRTLDEIAESPPLWWKVRNRIETEKARRASNWLAAWRSPVLAFGVPAILLCTGLALAFLNFPKNSDSPLAAKNSVHDSIAARAETPAGLPDGSPRIAPENPTITKNRVTENNPAGNIGRKTKSVIKNQQRQILTRQIANSSKREAAPREETKTDFIALSYAAASDSGQIVRVKVPGAMMVSLGLKPTVEKESELVNAEVVVGDDGLARAIRFIR